MHRAAVSQRPPPSSPARDHGLVVGVAQQVLHVHLLLLAGRLGLPDALEGNFFHAPCCHRVLRGVLLGEPKLRPVLPVLRDLHTAGKTAVIGDQTTR